VRKIIAFEKEKKFSFKDDSADSFTPLSGVHLAFPDILVNYIRKICIKLVDNCFFPSFDSPFKNY